MGAREWQPKGASWFDPEGLRNQDERYRDITTINGAGEATLTILGLTAPVLWDAHEPARARSLGISFNEVFDFSL